MHQFEMSAERLVSALLKVGEGRHLALLDSCGVGKRGANRLIAGLDPVEIIEIELGDPDEALERFAAKLTDDRFAAIFTISYDLGLKLIGQRPRPLTNHEPAIYLGLYDGLFIHDYDAGRTSVAGRSSQFEDVFKAVHPISDRHTSECIADRRKATSNYSQKDYLAAIEEIKELIRCGETYQTNLTQQLTVPLAEGPGPVSIFEGLRRSHPAPFAAYIDRGNSKVVSASPEQFIRIETNEHGRKITSSPIKGTRPRGRDDSTDAALRAGLAASEKDRAENMMIVDLMRNDLGRICEFGSVSVTELCRVEEHPTLFHLVSTVEGMLRPHIAYADVLRAVFPCGSITGAPKVRTMEIIERLEPDARGLSMGAIGCRLPCSMTGAPDQFEMSVAIRTMMIRNDSAVFNVGGGVVIDSDPIAEYEESLLKARALLTALNASTPTV